MDNMRTKLIMLITSIFLGSGLTYLVFYFPISSLIKSKFVGQSTLLGIPFFEGTIVDGTYLPKVNNFNIILVSICVSLLIYLTLTIVLKLIRGKSEK